VSGAQQFSVQGGNLKAVDDSFALSYNGDGILIGPTGQRLAGKSVRFTLSNPGGSTIIVNRIFVKVLEATPYKEYSFPRGPLAPVNEYKFDVALDPHSDTVLVTSQLFKYSRGEVDAISVHITSTDHYLYRFKIVAQGYDAADSTHHFNRETGIYQIAFPDLITYQSIILSAKKSIDMCFDPWSATDVISNLADWIQLPHVPLRIVTDRDGLYRDGDFRIALHEVAGRLYSTSQLLLLAGYRSVATLPAERSLACGYIIVDGARVLVNRTSLLLGRAELLESPAEVKRFVREFNSLFKPPYLAENVFRSAFATGYGPPENMTPVTNLVIPRRGDRLDEWMYLLRFSGAAWAIDSLAAGLGSSNSLVRSEAKRSLMALEEHTDWSDEATVPLLRQQHAKLKQLIGN
jgi:hypothetical protein